MSDKVNTGNNMEDKKLIKNAMSVDNSWKVSAKHYLDVYKELSGKQ